MTTIQWRSEIERSSRARGHDLDPGVLEELAIHAQTSYTAARADGLSVDEARERVRLEIDALTSEAQELRPRPGPKPGVRPPRASSSTIAGLAHDLRYGARLAIHRPGATVVSMLTIALGIAATTTLFGLAYGVLLRPLPWPDAGRLVRVTETRRDATRALPFLSNITYNAWNDKPSTIEHVAGYLNRTFALDSSGSVERIQGVDVTPSLFPLLRATPRAGRVFDTPDEDAVLVSERFARSRFADSASAIGQRLTLSAADGIPIGPARRDATIVGVMPDDFAFPTPDVDLWVPFAVRPTTPDGSLAIFLAIARLRPGATVEQAAAEATARGRSAPDPGAVAVGMFGGGGPVEVRLEPWLDSLTDHIKPGLLVLLAGVTLLLLAAAGSLANVQLARATGRRRELAIRAALGAGRFRLARQLLGESVIVAAAGGAIGLLLTSWLHRVLPSWMPADFPRLDAVSFDPTIAGVGAGLALVTGLLVGILPASQVGRLNLVSVLSEDGQAPVGHSRRSPVARARALAELSWRDQYPELDPDYVTTLCRDGGPYDLRPGTAGRFNLVKGLLT